MAEHCSPIAEARSSNAVEVPKFFSSLFVIGQIAIATATIDIFI